MTMLKKALFHAATFASLLIMTLLSACSHYIGMNSTYFYQQEVPTEGTVLIVAADHEHNESLEFQHYKSLFANKLTELGFNITDEKSEAELVALISYGIDTGKTVVKSQPIYGYTGYYGRYSMPHYSVVGVSNTQSTEYLRAIAMDLVDAQSIHDGKPNKIYEVRVKSRGQCANLNQVFPAMLTGMFTQFPGESGQTEYIEVEAEDC